MILLNSNAQQIYWFGRYLQRLQYISQQFPFQTQAAALRYAHAFGLEIEDAAQLNADLIDPKQPNAILGWLNDAKNNLYDLRAVLSTCAFARLNTVLQTAIAQALAQVLAFDQMLDPVLGQVLAECNAVIEAEHDPVLLSFFQLGCQVEILDQQIRLDQQCQDTLQVLVQLLHGLDFPLDSAVAQPSMRPASSAAMHFQHMDQQIQRLFARDCQ